MSVHQARLNGVAQAILRCLVDDVDGYPLLLWCVRKGEPLRTRSRQTQGKRRLTLARIALNHADLSERNERKPQPIHLLQFYISHPDEPQFVFIHVENLHKS